MKIATYLINLDGSDERLASATAQLQQHGIAFERISAVDGRKIPTTELEQLYDKKRAIAYMGRDLSAGEVGCYLSHIKALEAFIASDADIAVVLEDDFRLLHPYAAPIKKAAQWLQEHGHANWQAINISNNKLKIATALSPISLSDSNSSQLCQAHYFPMLATAIVWSRAGAAEFLKVGVNIFCPYDNFLRYWQTRANKGYSIFPPLLCTTEVASDIDAAGKRKSIQRGAGYGLAKQKRLWQDKCIAAKNKFFL
jgi:glycosyl transferase family 25